MFYDWFSSFSVARVSHDEEKPVSICYSILFYCSRTLFLVHTAVLSPFSFYFT